MEIETYPNDRFYCSVPFLPVAKINIRHTVKRNYLKPHEELTRDKALAIFQDMKWLSDFKARLLHPGTLITIGVLGVLPSLLTPLPSGPLGVLINVVCVNRSFLFWFYIGSIHDQSRMGKSLSGAK